jgi:hypothetical protein
MQGCYGKKKHKNDSGVFGGKHPLNKRAANGSLLSGKEWKEELKIVKQAEVVNNA